MITPLCHDTENIHHYPHSHLRERLHFGFVTDKGFIIHLFHKWRLINNSFVFMKISVTSLVSISKIQ